MSNGYIYRIETFIKSHDAVSVDTSRARIELIPDHEQEDELRTAKVTIEGHHKLESFFLAREELAKVLLRYTRANPKLIVDLQGFLPDKWQLESGEIVSLREEVEIISPQARKKILRWFNPEDDWCLRVNVNSKSPAILCYYEATRRDHAIDKYRELFKVIEYFSDIKEEGKRTRDLDHIRDHLGVERGWDIDETALSWAKQVFQEDNLTESDLAKRLIDLRDECSHLRPNYGLKPNDYDSIARINAVIPALDRIVRHSLEEHPETRERT